MMSYIIRRTFLTGTAGLAFASMSAAAIHHDFLPQDVVPDLVARFSPQMLGEIAPSYPVMQPLERHFDFQRRGFRVTAVSEVSLRAVVLSRKRYFFDRFRIAPIDLVLGWGEMSNPAIFRTVRVSVQDRDFRWEVRPPPRIARDDVATLAGLFHVIPSRSSVQESVSNLRRNHVVDMSGFLCSIKTPEDEEIPPTRPSVAGSRKHVLLLENISVPVIS